MDSKNIISGIAGLFFSFSCIASPPIQSATGNTQIDQTPDGVAVINIAPPNQAGISHNQYHQFNVEQQGAVLNNAAGQSAQTQLAGNIAANPNLAGGAAAGIVNEVVSANRSQLQGYLEVGGKAASVVVANPYGITCDGCGFINTPHAVVTTGRPEWGESGELKALAVQQGDILLQGKGLDATQSDKLALITRAAQINAQLRARDTTVILGSNRVTSEGQIIPLATAESIPEVAIDTGALGGMYSNSIRLVASEKGVGVNLANLTAVQGDISLQSNGQLVLNNTAAKGDLRVQSEEIILEGSHPARGDIQLSADYFQAEEARVQAGHDLNILADFYSYSSIYHAENNINATSRDIFSYSDSWKSGNDIIIQGGLYSYESNFTAGNNIIIQPKEGAI
ncbi:filamentous hemagglutinin N-terminal domain-containing protein [Phytobacter sp. V91]|uniref:filamentous hemagglutinin N-terminal domain-containing protein n=1 Tax=Phytobacter sp. V91 TaxID=3369425 RepID=UPI003F642B34